MADGQKAMTAVGQARPEPKMDTATRPFQAGAVAGPSSPYQQAYEPIQLTWGAHPQYANYWAPLTRKRHIPPHPAQPQHTN